MHYAYSCVSYHMFSFFIIMFNDLQGFERRKNMFRLSVLNCLSVLNFKFYLELTCWTDKALQVASNKFWPALKYCLSEDTAVLLKESFLHMTLITWISINQACIWHQKKSLFPFSVAAIDIPSLKMVKPKCRHKTILARARRLPAQEDSRTDLYCRGPVRFQRNSTERATWTFQHCKFKPF